jgi:hypothetical protein
MEDCNLNGIKDDEADLIQNFYAPSVYSHGGGQAGLIHPG